jgi:hypothetical protein
LPSRTCPGGLPAGADRATGYTGRVVVQALVRRGALVRAMVRAEACGPLQI